MSDSHHHNHDNHDHGHHHGHAHHEAPAPACCHGAAETHKPAPVATGAWVCPMCPGVASDKPGPCPKCGMALEPAHPAAAGAPSTPARCIPRSVRTIREAARSAAWRWSRSPVGAEQGPNPELIDMARRFWVSLVFTVPLFLLAMGRASAVLAQGRCFFADRRPLGSVRAGEPGAAVVRLAVLRARGELGAQPQPQHVHPDRHGHRRRLSLQRRGGDRPGDFPAVVPRPRRPSVRTSRRPP